MTGILGAAGRPMVGIGGQFAHKEFTKGNIKISLQWLELHEPAGIHACMCIYPANVMMMNIGAFVIPMSAAYMFFEKSGKPSRYLLQEAVEAVKFIGLFPDRSTVFRMCEAIVDAIPDFFAMCDDPDDDVAAALFEKPKAGVEVTVTKAGKTMLQEVA